ncbi:MAG TPA: hypothetical protein V6D02_16730 [Candidatus Obscuribacterales bacterium]
MTFYLLAAIVTAAMLLSAFWQDTSTAKQHRGSWIFLVVSALCWPLTLSFVLAARQPHRSVYRYGRRVYHYGRAWGRSLLYPTSVKP